MAPHCLWRHLGTYMAASWHPSVLPWCTVGPLSTLMAHFVQFSVAPWCPFSSLIVHLVVPVAPLWHPCVPQGASLASLWALCPPQYVHGTHRSSMVPFWYPVRSLSTCSAASWHLMYLYHSDCCASLRYIQLPPWHPVALIPVHSLGVLAALCGHAKCILSSTACHLPEEELLG